MHPNENLLATQTPIHANMSHAVGPDSGSRARPRARSARTHQTTGCRAPRATCARRRRATPQGRSSRPRGTAAPTCRAAQASVGLHATRAPPPTPDRGARTCRISPVHVRRQTLHGSSASPIFVTVYEASQTGIARRSVRASSTSAAHTRMRRLVTGAGASSQSKGVTSSADARVGEWTGRHGSTSARAHARGATVRPGQGAGECSVRGQRTQRERPDSKESGAHLDRARCTGRASSPRRADDAQPASDAQRGPAGPANPRGLDPQRVGIQMAIRWRSVASIRERHALRASALDGRNGSCIAPAIQAAHGHAAQRCTPKAPSRSRAAAVAARSTCSRAATVPGGPDVSTAGACAVRSSEEHCGAG